MDRKNNGKEIVFRSRMKLFYPFIGELFTVTIDGDMPEQFPYRILDYVLFFTKHHPSNIYQLPPLLFFQRPLLE